MRPTRTRRSNADHLRDALDALAGGQAQFLRHEEKSWASITFAGARHSWRLRFDGADAVAAAEYLIAELPEHEFTIPGQLVADATICAVDHTMLPEPHMIVDLELLMLEES
ncbi:hypothetical protein D6851_09420 [Altericroceibacterium spongiae]|uniref:Uncharacterized protein n=2 Tax=Altericroceibacterium spongiae TaxID=2320269 RepID=A0A420EKZ0_9SPHN|nr:hypothetical protein D6851_09420 [Altericroceibacterium spongiae]